MLRNLGILFCVIAVPLFAVSVAEPTKPCSETSEAFRNAGDHVKETFKVLVKEAIDHPDNLTKKLDEFEQDLNNFVRIGNESCKGIVVTPANFTLFRSLVEFSLKDVKILKEIMKKENFECIESLKNNITTCISTTMKRNETERTSYGQLAVKGYLKLNDSHMGVKCPQSTEIKTCTVNVLKQCKPVVAAYVESLFNFTYSAFCKNLTNNNNITSGTARLDRPGFYGMLACGLLVLNL